MLLLIPHPPMEFRSDALKVLVLSALQPWTDRLGVTSSEPVLEEVHVFFFAQLLQRLHMLLPRRVDTPTDGPVRNLVRRDRRLLPPWPMIFRIYDYSPQGRTRQDHRAMDFWQNIFWQNMYW